MTAPSAQQDYNGRQQRFDLEVLGNLIRENYTEIIVCNLTRNTYRLLQYGMQTSRTSHQEGNLDEGLARRLQKVAPDDRAAYAHHFFRESLIQAFTEEGKTQVSLTYRWRNEQDDGWTWRETRIVQPSCTQDNDLVCVATIRNITTQHERETGLQRDLYLQQEELRLTLAQMGKILNYYDIASRTLSMSPAFAEPRGLPPQLHNYPESLFTLSKESFPEATVHALTQMYQDIRHGSPKGSIEIAVTSRDGQERWERVSYATICDENNVPQKAVISIEDTSEAHTQLQENRRLRKNEQILRIATLHSNRSFCLYDIKSGFSRQWNKLHCQSCVLPHLCEMPYTEIIKSPRFFPQSAEALKQIFEDIHNGGSAGEHMLHCRDLEGEPRWYDLKYTTLKDEFGQPVSAMFSFKDITEQYVREIAYQRHVQHLQENSSKNLLLLEIDLTDTLIERQGGRLFSDLDFTGKPPQAFYDVIQPLFAPDDWEDAKLILLPENLLSYHKSGILHLEKTWPITTRDGQPRWACIGIEMVMESYGGHIKVFLRVEDVTEQKEELLAIKRRAEQDGMTGLLNRNTCEERIRNHLSSTAHRQGGVLVLVDLDDLKGINDTLGHEHGDKAIKAIAATLKGFFRKDDIVGRLGGDEFIVFLPGAAGHETNLALSLSRMLRSLSRLTVGENGERTIHCSLGCASETVGKDSFETLYKRADLALYHVKRSGKANLAFYNPEMEGDEYRLRNQAGTLKHARITDWSEFRQLLHTFAHFYPLLISATLDTDSFTVMEAAENDIFAHIPPSGSLRGLAAAIKPLVAPNHAADVERQLSREALLAAQENGSEVSFFCRCASPDLNRRWLQFSAFFFSNDKKQPCCFIFARWAMEYGQSLAIQRLQKMLEVTVATSFEYVCIIDVASRTYTQYSNDGHNSHIIAGKGLFDAVTCEIRDTHIPEPQRADYYAKANLDTVLEHMHRQGCYGYTYTLADGQRTAAFHWYEQGHDEILMTVSRR